MRPERWHGAAECCQRAGESAAADRTLVLLSRGRWRPRGHCRALGATRGFLTDLPGDRLRLEAGEFAGADGFERDFGLEHGKVSGGGAGCMWRRVGNGGEAGGAETRRGATHAATSEDRSRRRSRWREGRSRAPFTAPASREGPAVGSSGVARRPDCSPSACAVIAHSAAEAASAQSDR